MRTDQVLKLSASLLIVFALTFLFPLSALSQSPRVAAPKFSKAVAFDVSAAAAKSADGAYTKGLLF